jgi:TrmH family RNA methyltransferase
MIITSRQNPLVKHLRRLCADAAYRRETGLYIADGGKLLTDALLCGVIPAQIVKTAGAVLPETPDSEVVTVAEELMEYISPLQTPQGLLFVCPIPQAPPVPEKGRWLLLDRVQDPGNAGSILRTAEAFGLDGVLLSPGCADPFGPKAVRAAMGATFRLPIYCGGGCEPRQMSGLADCGDGGSRPLSFGIPLFVADMGGDIISAFPKDCIVALGNEGQGVSGDIKLKADKMISIPMPGKAESLGVAAAAAIICWELSKG